ncbi:MAG TPA: dihydrodipicolinate synthase family protein [Pyrinomonadaceae bacterium]|nr:dihydrodipicolinate synthase family protein [Pyrinomonadaceae bacterium]
MNGLVFSNVTELQAQLAGRLVPAAPVPFDSDGRLHAAAHQSYLRYMSSQPIAGVAVWAHTGRGLTLDGETAGQVLQDWRSALPEKIIIAGVGATGTTNPERATALTINMAERAAKMGADALLVYPPTWLRHHHLCDQLTIVHHQCVSEVGLPMILFYLYEAAGGISYSSTMLDELLGVPQVLGIKVATLDSVITYQTISRQLQERHPDKLLITGEDRFLGYSLRRGARAALVGLGAICCELQAELIRANEAGNTDRFLELSDAVDMLAESIFISPMEGYIKRILWALVHLGVIPLAAANDPWAPQIPPSQFDEIGRRLAALTSEAQVN